MGRRVNCWWGMIRRVGEGLRSCRGVFHAWEIGDNG